LIVLILSETNRSRFYLNYILKYKIFIDQIIYFTKEKKKLFKIIEKKKLNKKTYHIKTNTINSKKIEKFFLKNKIKKPLIYSGYPGEIIQNDFLLKKNLIHFHSGDLPLFKGSTTIFYSILMKKKITVTCFKMKKGIDEGKILYKKRFNIPKNKKTLNSSYDDKIRAETMIEFLKNGKKNYKNTIKSKYFDTYYVAHPLIRGIAIHKEKFKKIYSKKW